MTSSFCGVLLSTDFVISTSGSSHSTVTLTWLLQVVGMLPPSTSALFGMTWPQEAVSRIFTALTMSRSSPALRSNVPQTTLLPTRLQSESLRPSRYIVFVGRGSTTVMSSASPVPLFSTWIVYLMTSSFCGVLLSTDFVISTSGSSHSTVTWCLSQADAGVCAPFMCASTCFMMTWSQNWLS